MAPTRSARSYLRAGISPLRFDAGGVAEEHREAVRPLLHIGEEGERGPFQALARRARRDRLDDAADDVLHLAVDDHGVQPFLAAEVLVDDRLLNAGPPRDLLDPRRLVATRGETR